MAYTFKKAAFGVPIGESLFDAAGADRVADVLAKAKRRRVRVHLPVDYVTADRFHADAAVGAADDGAGIPAGWMGLDIGPRTAELFAAVVRRAALLVWNGPMGVFEFDRFAGGSRAVLEAAVEATQRGGTTVIGGGDTATLVAKFGAEAKLSHVSTGGGATLELLEGKLLPGVAALSDAPPGSPLLFEPPAAAAAKPGAKRSRTASLTSPNARDDAGHAVKRPEPSKASKASGAPSPTPTPPPTPAAPISAFGAPRVGLQGGGKLARMALRAAFTSHRGRVQVVAINEPAATPDALAYLLARDSSQGPFPLSVQVTTTDAGGPALLVGGKHRVAVFACRDAGAVPWASARAEIVVDCTGDCGSLAQAALSLRAGAKKVIVAGACPGLPIVAPCFAEAVPFRADALSLGPFELHAAAPVVQRAHHLAGVEAAAVTVVCPSTAGQKTVDGPDTKDWRAGRGSRQNVSPGTSLLAPALAEVLPGVSGRVGAATFRVPTAAVAAVDVTLRLSRPLPLAALTADLEKLAAGKWRQCVGVTRAELVSSDIRGDPRSCVVDASAGIELSTSLIKVVVWADAEWAFAQRCLDTVALVAASDRNPLNQLTKRASESILNLAKAGGK